jgi:hypothetical protein
METTKFQLTWGVCLEVENPPSLPSRPAQFNFALLADGRLLTSEIFIPAYVR